MDIDPQLLNMNLMASLRTNNLIVDMAIAMIVPFVMRGIWNFFSQLWPLLRERLDKLFLRTYRRQILHSYEARPYYEVETPNRNAILQYAIRQYIGRVVQSKYLLGEIKLSQITSKKSAESRGSIAAQLENRYKVVNLPQKGEFVEIEPGLRFMERVDQQSAKDNDRGKERGDNEVKGKTYVTMTFDTHLSGGKERVEAFVKKAMDWYVAEVAKDEDNSRFMFQPLVKDKYASSDEKQKPRMYKRYKLSGEKTFNSLFFPEKARLLRILSNFQSKAGKYSIKGFPHKLGLLLHGPPGTGKTSLVKAIAAHTGRHIVSVPLSRMNTNQELMDVMFDQLFNYKKPAKRQDDDDGDDQGTKNKLRFEEVIFLLEDVDAASDIVHARKAQKQSTMTRQMSMVVEKQYADATSSRPPSTPPPMAGAADPAMLLSLLQLAQKTGADDAKDGDGKVGKESKEGKQKDYSSFEKDKLNLAGLLTVLDGVIDSPGRILIMTTNHPEKLDPALTRPGRVNMQIYMGFIRIAHAKEMVLHYYGASEATTAKLAMVEKAFEEQNAHFDGAFKMSPAEMEQLCAENDSVEALCSAILRKGR
jgi:chaperone BCS1